VLVINYIIIAIPQVLFHQILITIVKESILKIPKKKLYRSEAGEYWYIPPLRHPFEVEPDQQISTLTSN